MDIVNIWYLQLTVYFSNTAVFEKSRQFLRLRHEKSVEILGMCVMLFLQGQAAIVRVSHRASVRHFDKLTPSEYFKETKFNIFIITESERF